MKTQFLVNIFSCLLLTKIEFAHSDTAPTGEKHKVIIIGAGISGLGAATHLLKNNVTDILILEASDRIGGRVYTAPFGDYLIEYGAQWVHGQGGNVVYEICQLLDIDRLLDVQVFNEIPNFFISPTSKINLPLANDLYAKAAHYFDDLEELSNCNCSSNSYFDARFNNLTQEENPDEATAQAIKDAIKKFEGSMAGTDDLENLGTWGIQHYGETNGSLTTAWKSGYHTFIDILLGKFPKDEKNELAVLEKTKFNKVVQSIHWNGDAGIEISCEDGSNYKADYVINTVSLGVLKHSAKTMFHPKLPDRKLSAIQAFGFDVVDKILIQFETRWWPLVHEYEFVFLWSDEDKEKFRNESKYGGWATEISGFHSVENQPRILEGWIAGKSARKVEQLSDKEVTDAVMELFHWFLDGKFSISRPINIARSAWASNRFVRGSYSFRTLENDHHGYSADDIAQPLFNNHSKAVLLFAGEATNDLFYGTVHGALESGWREAKRIISLEK